MFFILLFKVREEIEKFGIKVYQFPDCDSDEDEEFKQQDRELKVNIMTQTHKCPAPFNIQRGGRGGGGGRSGGLEGH